MILFLDFDGVTHPISGSLPFEPSCINALSTVVKQLDAKIVIASTWRYKFSLDDMQEFLGKTLAPRVIDITPDLDLDPFLQWPRAREVAAWLESNKSLDRTWVAIDDEEGNYPQGLSYLCERNKGFTNSDIAPFIKYSRLSRNKIQSYL